MEEIKRFLESINDLVSWKEKISNQKGENFNVFKLCGVNHYENSHSDIIAEFLNPKGSHGCGSDFLLEFCRIVGLDASQYENADVDVTREHQILGGSGRVDIIIEAGTSKLIIENKIYANEGEGQLRKYRDWLDNNSGEKAPLFFLTLDGRKSNDGNMNIDHQYTPISYRSHIIDWLNTCIRIAAEKPFVRESLIQYKNLVEDLTKGNIMEFDQNLLSYITSNFQSAITVSENIDKAKAQWYFSQIIRPLLQKKNKGITVDVSDKEDGWMELIRDKGLDCFISFKRGTKKVVYAYDKWNFQNPRREILTYPDEKSEDFDNRNVTRGDDMPHRINDDFWGNSNKAKEIVNSICADIDKIFETK